MNKSKLFLSFSLLFFMQKSTAQDLSAHQWQDRLILVLAKDSDDVTYQKQIKLFQAAEAGLKERKLVVYHIFPDQYQTGLVAKDSWMNSSELYGKYHRTEASFEVLLIGLDGGIKLRKTEVLTTQDLFAIIDGMPMRRAEIRRKQH